MSKIIIENRQLTREESAHMDAEFDQLAIDEGVALESTERFSFVASNGDAFLGCASGLAHKNGDVYSGWFFITDLFVEKDYRSQGLGSRLLRTLEKTMKSIDVKHAYLWTSHDKALRFYEREGYRPFVEMEDWYSDGNSRVGLRKDF